MCNVVNLSQYFFPQESAITFQVKFRWSLGQWRWMSKGTVRLDLKEMAITWATDSTSNQVFKVEKKGSCLCIQPEANIKGEAKPKTKATQLKVNLCCILKHWISQERKTRARYNQQNQKRTTVIKFDQKSYDVPLCFERKSNHNNPSQPSIPLSYSSAFPCIW